MEVSYIDLFSFTEPKGGYKEVIFLYLGLITNFMTGVVGLILLLLLELY